MLNNLKRLVRSLNISPNLLVASTGAGFSVPTFDDACPASLRSWQRKTVFWGRHDEVDVATRGLVTVSPPSFGSFVANVRTGGGVRTAEARVRRVTSNYLNDGRKRRIIIQRRVAIKVPRRATVKALTTPSETLSLIVIRIDEVKRRAVIFAWYQARCAGITANSVVRHVGLDAPWCQDGRALIGVNVDRFRPP